MPCAGPSEGEMRNWEREENLRIIGKRWDNEQAAINVACALWNQFQKGTPAPEWVYKWGRNHDRKDAERKAMEENDKAYKRSQKLAEFKKLKKDLKL